MDKLSYHRHRFPSIIIQQAVWLYFRFGLSYRDVEDMLAERGIDVTYETVRRWGFEIRHDHCAQAETRTAAAKRTVASQRSVRLHQRQTAVRLACCRQ
jgi:transposase-like protein